MRSLSKGLVFGWMLVEVLSCPGLSLTSEKQNREAREKSLRRETSDRYLKKWIDQDVLYIISKEEKRAFKKLTTDEERYQFIEQFWLRRDPAPDTVDNEARNEHYRRITYANEHFASGFPGWKTDRGRIYITFGPPDEIEAHPTGGAYDRPFDEGGGDTSTYPFEVWRYRYLEGEALGNQVMIEFVDRTLTGEYRMTMNPFEKDALSEIPGVGLTDYEQRGLSSKADRNRLSGSGLAQAGIALRQSQLQRLEQFATLHRPPEIKFKDLESVINTKVSYNLLPFKFRTHFIKITEDTVLTPITIQLRHEEMTFKNENGVQRARINIFGRVSTITGRVVQVFEDVVLKDIPDSLFKEALEQKSLYQKALPLRSGRYKLELVLKDLNSGNMGTEYVGFVVPQFEEDKLATSSIILADRIQKLPSSQVGAGMFVIGGTKVHPNVRDRFDRGKNLGVYFQIYHLTSDEKSKKPSVSIDYILEKENREIYRLGEDRSKLSSASQQMTLQKLLPLKILDPGQYRLKVKVTDNLSNRSVSEVAKFEVR